MNDVKAPDGYPPEAFSQGVPGLAPDIIPGWLVELNEVPQLRD
jgi:hypothetical protein